MLSEDFCDVERQPTLLNQECWRVSTLGDQTTEQEEVFKRCYPKTYDITNSTFVTGQVSSASTRESSFNCVQPRLWLPPDMP